VLSGIVSLIYTLIELGSIGSLSFVSTLSGSTNILDLLATLIVTPVAALVAGFCTGAPITVSFSGLGSADLYWTKLGAWIILYIILFLVILAFASFLCYKVQKNKAFDFKQAGAFVGSAALFWLLICIFTSYGSVSLSWLVVLSGAILAVLAEVIGGLALPRIVASGGAYFDRIAETKFFQAMSGTFAHGGPIQVVPKVTNPLSTAPASAYQVPTQPIVQPAAAPVQPAPAPVQAPAPQPVPQPVVPAQPAAAPVQPVAAPAQPTTWTCPKCGHVSSIDKHFCVKCGTPQPTA
jgi:hypothetical protein